MTDYITSNSEIEMYEACPKQHHYAFALGIRPRGVLGRALGFGVLGHSVWETYYRALLSGLSKPDAYQEAAKLILTELTSETSRFSAEACSLVSNRFSAYVERWKGEPLRVLGVEQSFQVVTVPGQKFAFTVDLLVEATGGNYKGEVLPMDYKWTYNFWPEREVSMHPQFPKYAWGLRELGYPTKRAVLDQIRYRQDAKELFKRTPTNASEIFQDNVMAGHIETATKLRDLSGMPVSERAKLAKPHLNRRRCGFCDFSDLCFLELSGKDPTPTMSAHYMPTDYGYRK